MPKRKLKRPAMPGAGRPQVRLLLHQDEIVHIKIRQAEGETPFAAYTVRRVRGLRSNDKIIVLEPAAGAESEKAGAE